MKIMQLAESSELPARRGETVAPALVDVGLADSVAHRRLGQVWVPAHLGDGLAAGADQLDRLCFELPGERSASSSLCFFVWASSFGASRPTSGMSVEPSQGR